MKKRDEIKAVIFDIGGVLQLGEKQRKFSNQSHASGVHERAARKLKIDLDQYFDSIDSFYARSIEGKISKKELLKNLSFNLKTSEKKLEKLYFNLYKKKFKINKQLFKQATILKKQGYKVAILSDQWHLSKEAHYPKTFQKLFYPSIISCDVGIRKPHMGIYKLILKNLKLKPSETVFIDNQIWNIKPAEKLGMKTILFKNNEQTIRELNKILNSCLKQQ